MLEQEQNKEEVTRLSTATAPELTLQEKMFNEILKDAIVQSRLEWDNIERDNIKNEVEQIVSLLISLF